MSYRSENAGRWLAAPLAALRLHILRPKVRDGQEFVLKKRRWFVPLVRPLGNLIMALRRPPTRMLSASAWQRHEAAAFEALYGESTARDRGWLVMPCLEGVPLKHLLTSNAVPKDVKLQACSRAVRALHALHRTPWRSRREFLSHGDATVGNVLVTPSSAFWLDFDMVHVRGTRAIVQADDLRAFIVSAAIGFDEAEMVQLVNIVLAEYRGERAIDELVALVQARRLSCDLLHHAQSWGSTARSVAAKRAIIRATMA
jgi:tRNA A-37 threonylcarbamoyl transferase component Bud32